MPISLGIVLWDQIWWPVVEMFPWGDPQKTCERLLSLQLKLKRFLLLALEVSESVPSVSDGLGHHINEDVGFELLQSSDLQMIFLLGEGICHPLTTLSSRNLFWEESPSWHGAAGSFGGISSGSLCRSIVNNPTVRPDPILSSTFFSFPHPFSAFPILFQLFPSFCSCEYIYWQRWLPHGIAALRGRFPSHLVGAEEKYSFQDLFLQSAEGLLNGAEHAQQLLTSVQADGAQPLAEGAQCLVRLVQETYAVVAVQISSLTNLCPSSVHNGILQRLYPVQRVPSHPSFWGSTSI